MNQTRVFLIFAWLMVATLLWMEWNKEKTPALSSAATTTTQPSVPSSNGTLGVPTAANLNNASLPALPSNPATPTSSVSSATKVSITTDVLDLVLDGGRVLQADLLKFPQKREANSPPVRLFNPQQELFFAAESGWISNNPADAPNHLASFIPENNVQSARLADGENTLKVPFIWNGPNGVTIRRTYIFERGQYAIKVEDQVINNGTQPWNAAAYRQLTRIPPIIQTGMTHPESYSFNGATWFSLQDGYERRPFDSFLDDGKVNVETQQAWIALLQHHFFTAWIPDAADKVTVSIDQIKQPTANQNLIRVMGTMMQVPAGGQATTQARLYVGPKLVQQINAQNVKGLERAVDYSRFSILALLGEGLFVVLNLIHSVIGNWGWAIIGLVIVLKIVLFPLSAAQYKSSAKMRKLQPRLQQLKERYGDDKQKFQMAMMELYKKEKINPAAGCLPVLPQMIIFMSLYWVLVESVELRQAPWILWIQDLTAGDPYFILPILNIAIMYVTQKLTPMAPGMDPMQAKMMQFMPLVFGVMMSFMPSGLVLYWVTNGALGLLQQWWMLKKYGDLAVDKAVPAKA